MGLFTPKITKDQLAYTQRVYKQVLDCTALVNTTTSAKTFLGRLNMLLDCLLELQKFEKYKIFKGKKTPSKDYQRIIDNLELIVDRFLDRAIAENERERRCLQTDRAKENNYEKFVTNLYWDFKEAKTFWPGNGIYPHYVGSLLTQKNANRIRAMYDSVQK